MPRTSAKRQGLFVGFWHEPVVELIEGEPTVVVVKRNRVRRADLAEAYRLWAKHSDVRTGRV